MGFYKIKAGGCEMKAGIYKMKKGRYKMKAGRYEMKAGFFISRKFRGYLAYYQYFTCYFWAFISLF